MRLLAVAAVARHHGFELDRSDYPHGRRGHGPVAGVAGDVAARPGAGRQGQPACLGAAAAADGGAGAGPVNPVVLLFTDGSAGVLVASDASRNIVWIRDPRSAGQDAVAVDRLRLSQLWSGEAILVRRPRASSETDSPFTLMWVMRLLLHQRKLMNDIGIASLTLSVLTIIPPLLVMSVIDRVVGHHSYVDAGPALHHPGDRRHVRDAAGLCPARADPGRVDPGRHPPEPAICSPGCCRCRSTISSATRPGRRCSG